MRFCRCFTFLELKFSPARLASFCQHNCFWAFATVLTYYETVHATTTSLGTRQYFISMKGNIHKLCVFESVDHRLVCLLLLLLLLLLFDNKKSLKNKEPIQTEWTAKFAYTSSLLEIGRGRKKQRREGRYPDILAPFGVGNGRIKCVEECLADELESVLKTNGYGGDKEASLEHFLKDFLYNQRREQKVCEVITVTKTTSPIMMLMFWRRHRQTYNQ